MSESSAASTPTPKATSMWVLGAICLAGLVWANWQGLQDMAKRWSDDPRYSHGFLVPLFSAFVLWHRREMLRGVKFRSAWWGLLLVGVGVGMKLFGSRYFVNYIEQTSIIPLLAGVAALIGGWPLLRAAWPSVAFLIFMIPLPYRVEMAVGGPLQMIATRASTYALQTLGLPAFAEGTIIDVNSSKINVVEACNGLGMLMMFAAYAAGAVLIIDRPWFDKLTILVSAVPIAIFANAARITVTGLLYSLASERIAHVVYHDLAGWLMMPMALALLWLQLKVLSSLFVEYEPAASPAFAAIDPRVVRRPSRH